MAKGQVDPEAVQFPALAGQFLVIEEKLDGTGVSVFFDDNLELQIWHRGTPLTYDSSKEFKILFRWAWDHKEDLFDLLENRYILFGEWMLYKHTIFYDNLPAYFLESDIYDRKGNIWLSTQARNGLLTKHEYIHQVPVIATLKPSSINQITDLICKSRYQTDNYLETLRSVADHQLLKVDEVLLGTDQSGLIEGLYIKHEDERRIVERYKYVRYDFLMTILNSGTHLIDRSPIWNRRAGSGATWWP